MRILLSVLTTLMLFFTAQLSADVGEKELAGYRGAFMSRILTDNPGKEGDIRRCLGSMVKEGSSGSRLIDRFGLFLYDSRRNRLVLEKIRFFRDSGNALFFIILKDSSDGQLYSLYLEYKIMGKSTIKLKDTFFSTIYGDRISSVTRFFGGE